MIVAAACSSGHPFNGGNGRHRPKPWDDPSGRFGSRACENAQSGILPPGFGGTGMKRFVEGQDRSQLILLPECLDDYVGEENPLRVVDGFIDELELAMFQ